MKTTILKLVFAVGALFALANCSKSDDNSSVYGMCQAGQVNTQAGCISQQYCNGQYCNYNGQQLPILNNGYNNGYNNGMNCMAGEIYTTLGRCLPTAGCAPTYPNYGFYNGMCYPASSSYNTGYNSGTNNCQMNQYGQCVNTPVW